MGLPLPDHIIAEAASVCGCKESDVVSGDKRDCAVVARSVAARVMRTLLTHYSLPDIAAALGLKSHTSARQAVRRGDFFPEQVAIVIGNLRKEAA